MGLSHRFGSWESLFRESLGRRGRYVWCSSCTIRGKLWKSRLGDGGFFLDLWGEDSRIQLQNANKITRSKIQQVTSNTQKSVDSIECDQVVLLVLLVPLVPLVLLVEATNLLF